MSTLSAFSNTSRSIRARIEVDLTLSGSYTDFTSFLDNYTIYSSSDDKICGIYETYLDAVLKIPNPSIDWARPGRPVRVSVSITTDNWVTSHTEQLFIGTTSRQNTIPVQDVKIKATTYNSNFLDKKVSRQVFQNQDIASIMSSLLQQAGVSVGNISLSATGTVLPVYYISDNVPIREYIEDLCKPNLLLVGFDKDNVFRSSSIQRLTLSPTTLTPDSTATLSTTIEFRDQEITSKYYANTVRVKGRSARYALNELLYYNNQLQGYEIRPLGKLFFTLEIPDVQPFVIQPITARSRPAIGEPVSRGFYNDRSYFDFFTTDDSTGVASNGTIRVISQSIAFKDGKDVLFVVFENTNTTNSYYLKTLVLSGSGVVRTGEILSFRQSALNLQSDGQEILVELESAAIQNDIVGENTTNLLQVNLFQYANVYRVLINGRPNLQVGRVLRFQDRNGNNLDGIIYEIDSEVQFTEDGEPAYSQLVTVKVIDSANGYAQWDNNTFSWDGANTKWF